MTRPHMVRADTIDLQDSRSPSAQDHSKTTKGLNNSSPTRLAPHQDESIRQAERESLDEQARGPASPMEQKDINPYDDQHEYGSDADGSKRQHAGNGESGEEDSLDDSAGEDQLDDELMDKISSSPSIDDEDIDFEFVYALHTFVATVEGQANATKGDTMVLLDDSNSYWWLVRVVKDGSIGYLPAEHIETPTERLARLNKHRNIDLSATMLGDNAEKSKNPLKKAMRRRNAKTVTFSAPTYVEPLEAEYSTDEEDEQDQFFEEDEGSARTASKSRDTQDDDSEEVDIIVEPLRPKQQQKEQSQQSQQQQSNRTVADGNEEAESKDSLDQQHAQKESGAGQDDPVHGRSRNGTVRNTDSFFKDDSVETKKISLTPNLLRDETNGAAPSETKEAKGRGSLESLEKIGSGDKAAKEDKKRKEKKSGMLSGLFKRKDKKGKNADDDWEESEKISEESTRSSSPPKSSSESFKDDVRGAKQQQQQQQQQQPSPQRHPSKLQKPPPTDSPAVKEVETGADGGPASPVGEDHKVSMRMVPSEAQPGDTPQPLQVRPSESRQSAKESPVKFEEPEEQESHDPMKAAIVGAVKSPDKKSSSPQHTTNPFASEPQQPSPSSAEPTSASDTYTTGGLAPNAKEAQRSSPRSPSSPSSEHASHEAKTEERSPQTANPPTASENPTWDDACLRSYLEDGSDMRDLMIIIHDKTNVPAPSADHPITGSLFKEESKTLNDMSARLDDMLNSWLTRKSLSHIR